MAELELCFNGVHGRTGEPLVGEEDLPTGAALRRECRADRGLLGWQAERLARLASPHWGLPLDIDPLNPAQAGWGAVFHESETAEVRAALAPLIAHRERLCGAGRVRLLDYRDGEDWRTWLARHSSEPGSVRPDRLPYYLLLVGSPARIPFELQTLLAVDSAVGRLGFDRPDDYRRYVESVIAYETAPSVPNRRQAVVFGTRHDRATEILADHLAAPLADFVESRGFAVRRLLGGDATRANLGGIFAPPAGQRPPALVFTATHGVGFSSGDAAQRAEQGALACQEWSGAGRRDHFFAGDDLPADAHLHGLISFHFACHSAGAPDRGAILYRRGAPPAANPDEAFVARLPQRLLAHPRGGALAVIGHVDLAWAYSVVGADHGAHTQTFENTLDALLRGWPVGHAVRDFSQRCAALSIAVAAQCERQAFGGEVPQQDLRRLWTECKDARNYIVLGDPAARLRVADLPGEEG